jgi:hypothetical protein
MFLNFRYHAAWIFFGPLLLILAGCGGKNTTVTGRVTLGGQPVESGFITFFPEDNHGTSVGGEVIRGEYKVENILPGKKRVYVSITEQIEPAKVNVTKSRDEANAERLAGMKKKRTGSKQPASLKLEGNDKIVEIGSGSQQIDIPLEKRAAGK